MKRPLTAVLIVVGALLLFGGLIWAKIYLAREAKRKAAIIARSRIAAIPRLEQLIRGDSLYGVRDILYRDSAILVAVDNPEKTGTEAYFDRKYKLNTYDNINMVYIYLYDSTKPLQGVSFDDALMAKGKKMGRFQEEWVLKFIDSTDGSCIPLKKYLRAAMSKPESFLNEETTFQPASIHKMQVVCKYRSRDSTGAKELNVVTALIGADGSILSAEKNQ
jgi:hypothetical protein